MVASPETNGKVTETYVEVVERCELALPGHPSEWFVVFLATNTVLINHVSYCRRRSASCIGTDEASHR